jgi:phenylacetate-coenzyme A ligase PaaK-like adenylate-forming protein
MFNKTFIDEALNCVDDGSFESLSLELFLHQYNNNKIYHNYCNALKIAPALVKKIENIPFLPISFFKTHQVKTQHFTDETIFYSSGTTGSNSSKHHIKSLLQYEKVFLNGFKKHYGNPADWTILGLLPSYLEREGSSLIYMVNKLVQLSENPDSGFFLYNHESLKIQLLRNESMGKKSMLFGVTFALLDFAAKFELQLENTVIIETGGMKGRGEELTREEISEILKKSFGVESIHSEYGMTELSSQAYSAKDGIFSCSNSMRVLVRDSSDPLSVSLTGNGVLNIIDIANIDSVAFIATQDLGIVYHDGSFEVKGRMDNSDIRGCNLLIM